MNRRGFLTGLGILAAGLPFCDVPNAPPSNPIMGSIPDWPHSNELAERLRQNAFQDGDVAEFVGVKGFEDNKPYRITVG